MRDYFTALAELATRGGQDYREATETTRTHKPNTKIVYSMGHDMRNKRKNIGSRRACQRFKKKPRTM